MPDKDVTKSAYRIVSSPESHEGREIYPIDLEVLVSQLIPIRDALLKVFDGVPARGRGEVQRLEVGLTLTGRGVVAFPAEDMRPSLTLTLGARQRPVNPRSGTGRPARWSKTSSG